MRKLAFVCFPGFQSLDLSGPMEVFDYAREAGKPCYQSYVFSKNGGTVKSSSGLEVQTQKFRALKNIDTLIAIGGSGVYEAVKDKALIRYIQKQSTKVRRVVSICSGSFLLAEAGLLTGKKATTHWSSADLLSQTYPDIEVEPDAIYTRDGKVATSAGVTAGMDLSLALVEEDQGREKAMSIARMLVIYYRRSGGQSQFSEPLKAQSIDDERFSNLCTYIQKHLQEDLSVSALANKLSMSDRNFSRCFTEVVGESPGKYVESIRLTAAKSHLEDSAMSIQEVAYACGFKSVEILRRLFQRRYEINPKEYRSRFGCNP